MGRGLHVTGGGRGEEQVQSRHSQRDREVIGSVKKEDAKDKQSNSKCLLRPILPFLLPPSYILCCPAQENQESWDQG